MMINKKALSSILSNVLLILLSIIAVIALSIAVITFTHTLSSPSSSCAEIKAQPPLSLSSACFNKDTNQIEFRLQRDSSTEIQNFFMIIDESKGDSTSWQCGDCGGCTLPQKGSSKNYFIPALSPNKIKIVVNSCSVSEKKINPC